MTRLSPKRLVRVDFFKSELDRRHQSAFLKKRFFIHGVPPARAKDKKTLTKVGNKREMVISPNAISPKVISPNVFGHFA